MNLSDVYVFKKVALMLSFTKAARELGVSRSAVSKQIKRLEQDLGVVLVHRSTRSVNLTEAGRTFDCSTAEIDSTIEHAADLVRGADLSPLGTVAFTLPSGLGAALMPSLTSQFQTRWPELKLNIHFDDIGKDMLEGNLDLAIRISKKLADSSQISRRLASTRKVLAASPRYLRENGVPRSLPQLKDHRCLGLRSTLRNGTSWKLQGRGKIVDVSTAFALSTNIDLALILAARLDSGIIYVPEICIAGELARNQLQIIADCSDPESYGIYAIYPHRNAAAKVKVLVDFIKEMLAKIATIDYWAPLTERTDEFSNSISVDTHVH